MMKRVLFGLGVLACGMMPALAGPLRIGPGRPPHEMMPGERPFDARPGGDRRFGARSDVDEPGDEREEERPRRRADQDRARAQMRAGEIRPLRDIQQQWRRGMPGYDYLGSDFDAGAGRYRLKFLRDGSVIWIDVDGRTGREIGRHGR